MRRFTPMQQNFIDEYILSLDQTESATGLKPLVERIYKSLYHFLRFFKFLILQLLRFSNFVVL